MTKRRTGPWFFTATYGIILTAVFCNFLWGSAFPCVKTGYRLFSIESNDTMSQILFAGIRFLLAGIMVVTAGSIINRRILLPTGNNIKKILFLSLFQTVIQYILFYIGLANTSGVKGSIIEASSVFVAILISSLIFRLEKLSLSKISGCIIGFAGVVIVNIGGQGLDFSLKWNGEGLILMSTVSYAFSTVLMKRYSAKGDPVLLSGWQFISGGLIMIVMGAAGGGSVSAGADIDYLMLFYLAFISAAAYSLWGMLLKYNPVSRIAVFGFANPVFGVILSAMILKESSQAQGLATLTALLLVCAGIYLVNRADEVNTDKS